MRVGVALDRIDRMGWDELRAVAEAAESGGLDGLLLGASGADALLVAASLAGVTSRLPIVAEVALGGHPVHLAEKIAVADNSLGGRLSVVLRGDDAEAVEIVDAALRARPFRANGARWPVPARLPENSDARWSTVRVTPAPAQLALPLFVAGPASGELAVTVALPFVGEADEDASSLGERWSGVESRLGGAGRRLLRAARRAWSGDADATVSDLARCGGAFGLELAFLESSEGWDADALAAVRKGVWPRVQLDELPEGLNEFWNETVGSR